MARPVAPFRMQLSSCDFGAMGFEYDHGEYLVDIDSSQLERVKAAGYGGSSQMTPLRRINLPNAEQELNIPKEATMFAWAFPLHALGGSAGFAPQTPEEEAAVHGAFAYFKDADHLVASNAVRATPSGGLHCGGPHLLCGAAAAVNDGKRMRTHMRETGRIHPVSEALRLQGVEYFWWLGPEEPIAAEDGRMWPLGAFVYLYRDGDEAMDCLLAVTHPSAPAPPSPARPSAAAAAAAPDISPGHNSPADLRQRALAQLAKLKAEQGALASPLAVPWSESGGADNVSTPSPDPRPRSVPPR